MVALPKPKPPERICYLCKEDIPDNLGAHIGPCPENDGHPHIL